MTPAAIHYAPSSWNQTSKEHQESKEPEHLYGQKTNIEIHLN